MAKIEVKTTFNVAEIISETQMTGMDGQMEVIQRQVIKHQEEGVIQALKEMGWTPPVDIHRPIADLSMDQLKKFYGVTTPEQIIAQQASHIERLQAALARVKQDADFRVQMVRG